MYVFSFISGKRVVPGTRCLLLPTFLVQHAFHRDDCKYISPSSHLLHHLHDCDHSALSDLTALDMVLRFVCLALLVHQSDHNSQASPLLGNGVQTFGHSSLPQHR